MNEREINANHEQRLKQMCGLPQDKSLPKKVTDRYWERKIVNDRVQAPITDYDLTTIAVECGYGKLTEREANPTICEQFRTKKILAGSPVLCEWGNQTKTGKLARVTYGNQIGVIFDGDNEETILDENKVALVAT